MATWVDNLYPGGSRQVFAGDNFPFKRDPAILVLHSTETMGYPAYAYNQAPHLTANPRTRTWRQHRALDKPAWALKPGVVATNSGGAIQVEIIGYASTLKDIDQDDLNWLGGLIRMVMQQTGIPIQSSVTFGGVETYGIYGAKRLSAARWNSYVGILGHQHVPLNLHWDPGALDIEQWLTAIHGPVTIPSTPTPPTSTATTPEEDEDMKDLIIACYHTISLFDPSDNEVDIVQVLTAPIPRSGIPEWFWTQPASDVTLNALYEKYLHRSIDEQGLAAHRGKSNRQATSDIANSPEAQG